MSSAEINDHVRPLRPVPVIIAILLFADVVSAVTRQAFNGVGTSVATLLLAFFIRKPATVATAEPVLTSEA